MANFEWNRIGKMSRYKLVDLFAGAGGLSYGFLQTGKFKVEMAVEINESAQETYRKNHNNENVDMRGNILEVDFNQVKEKYGDIDFVIGGPPCQGFSNANRQKSMLISNNNKLVKEYIRAIDELRPKGFVLENVKTMDSETHKFYLSKDDINDNIINNLHKKHEKVQVASNSDIIKGMKELLLDIYKGNKNINLYLLNENVLAFIKNISKTKQIDTYINNNKGIWKVTKEIWSKYHSTFISEKYEELFNKLYDQLNNNFYNDVIAISNDISNLQKLLYKLKEIIDNKIIINNLNLDGDNVIFEMLSYNIFKYVKKKLISLGYVVDHFILNAADYGVAQQRNRLIVIGIKEKLLSGQKIEAPNAIYTKDQYMKIGDAIRDLEDYEVSFGVDESSKVTKAKNLVYGTLNGYLADSEIISNMTITETRKVAMDRFKALKPGENFHSLDESLKSTYAKPDRTQSSIYKRLDYDTTCGTVTNVRKSMWIHPKKDRALSIREAARLQSFPDSFEFVGTKDQQYQQIGNAVPPMLARVIAESVLNLIGDKAIQSLQSILKGEK